MSLMVTGQSGVEPQAPEVSPLLAIHRHQDGVVTFHRKGRQPGTFENLFGVRPRDLPELFPTFGEVLERDSYFSINAFWHRDARRQLLPATEARQANRLRYLCAAYTDLDIQNLQLDFGTALAAIVKRQDENIIPPASVIVRSGRGMWLLWFLHDARSPERPPGAFPEKLRLYLQVNRAIFDRLADLGADASARDPLRLVRVPGSVHPRSRTNLRVKYWLQTGADGRAYSYTLEDLARLMGISSTDSLPTILGRVQPSGNRGYAQLNTRRLREFSRLRAMRGGFAEGCRNRALLIYAWLLRCSRMAPEAILREAHAIAAECRPPLSAVETRQAVKTATGRKFARLRDQTISDWLDVTPAECAHLEKLPAATRFGRKPRAAPEGSRRLERRAAMLQILRERGAAPSCREMARLLRERQIEVSPMQVSRDYKAVLAE